MKSLPKSPSPSVDCQSGPARETPRVIDQPQKPAVGFWGTPGSAGLAESGETIKTIVSRDSGRSCHKVASSATGFPSPAGTCPATASGRIRAATIMLSAKPGRRSCCVWCRTGDRKGCTISSRTGGEAGGRTSGCRHETAERPGEPVRLVDQFSGVSVPWLAGWLETTQSLSEDHDGPLRHLWARLEQTIGSTGRGVWRTVRLSQTPKRKLLNKSIVRDRGNPPDILGHTRSGTNRKDYWFSTG